MDMEAELLGILAPAGPLAPAQVEMVNGYTSARAALPHLKQTSGLAAYLTDHPGGLVQVMEGTEEPGDLPYLTRTNIPVVAVHTTRAGAEALTKQVEKLIAGDWLAPTGWKVSGRESEAHTAGHFIKLVVTTQTPT